MPTTTTQFDQHSTPPCSHHPPPVIGEHENVTELEESLPFALEPPLLLPSRCATAAGTTASAHSLDTSQRLSSSNSLQPPALASSLISSPTATTTNATTSTTKDAGYGFGRADPAEMSQCSGTTSTMNSHGSDFYVSGSLLRADSHYLDVAASLLLPNSSLTMLMGSSTLQSSSSSAPTSTSTASATQIQSPSTLLQNSSSSQNVAWSTQLESVSLSSVAAPLQGGPAAGFSQLLNQADADRTFRPSSSRHRLPALPEEEAPPPSNEVMDRSSALFESPYSSPSRPARARNLYSRSSPHDERWSGMNSSSLLHSQETILAATTCASVMHSTAASPVISPERRMAALAGATARRTSDTSFEVAVQLSALSLSSSSPALSSSSSPRAGGSCSSIVEEIMDVVGNPDLLRLWCDPISSVVITRSSEGARNAANVRGQPTQLGRESHAGEWIEATVPHLIPPSHKRSCLVSAQRAVAGALGFPYFGKVVMFVERQRGQVGLTIGTFAGGVDVSHKLTIDAMSDHKVRILDQVRLQRPADDRGSGCCSCWCSCCCCAPGLWDQVQRPFLPTLDDYMDQVLSSMARLRFLVENGEATGYVPPPSPHLSSSVSSPPLHHQRHGNDDTYDDDDDDESAAIALLPTGA